MRSDRSSSNVIALASWRSPNPYLFIGMTTLVLFVSIIFTVLAFFYWKLCDNTQEIISDGKALGEGCGQIHEIHLEDMEAKVMVIMVGDEKPTYLGKSVPCAEIALDTVAKV